MSFKTPSVLSGLLYQASTAPIEIDTPAWFAWLANDAHHSFHFTHADGDFTARKERKQRGQWYWVAYRQAHCKLHKAYLGKSETLNAARLHAVAQTLARACKKEIIPEAS
ncbi:MAG: hypothetical protein JST60_17595 [Chloroflexi bacterium SZAS-1]|jgi:LuxR family maltose regulon positive regulatory protein|nr:hypothetical protein [Chloroflexi bacterium SZAS-1]HNP87873.1 hypothetical protein [Kouleothrix sp.]